MINLALIKLMLYMAEIILRDREPYDLPMLRQLMKPVQAEQAKLELGDGQKRRLE